MGGPIPYGRQTIDQADIQAVCEVFKTDFLTTGPKIPEFERAIKETSEAKNVVVFNSGTSALHAAYFAAGFEEGDEIITSPMTFAATANAALYLNGRVKFADIDIKTGNIDPQSVERLITDKTKLIVPVDYSGIPAPYDEIAALTQGKEIRVIGDSSHSLGAKYFGKKVGEFCETNVLSFHPVKPITSVEGGAILTSDDRLAKKARLFRSHGIEKELIEAPEYHGAWYTQMIQLGFNYRMSDVHAALGLSQIRKLESFLQRRREIASFYFEKLKDLDFIELPQVPDGVESGFHLFVVRLKEGLKARFEAFNRLREKGILVQVHYLPVYLHPFYKNLGYEKGTCPQAEKFYEGCISLPIFPNMTREEMNFVAEELIQLKNM